MSSACAKTNNTQWLVLLAHLLERDEQHKWLRIQSAFYDKTGRRLHPLDIKEKMSGELE